MPVPVPEPWSLEEPDFDEIEIGSAAKGSAESVSADVARAGPPKVTMVEAAVGVAPAVLAHGPTHAHFH